MSSISRSTALTFLTQIPTQLFGIIAGIFITRILGPEGRGVYAIFLADIALFSTLLGFSISTAIIQFKASNRLPEGKLLGVSLLFSLVTIVLSLILVLVWALSPYDTLLLPDGYLTFNFIAIFLVFLAITQINTVYSAYFQGARRFDVVNRVLLINSLINFGSYGVLFLLHHNSIIEAGLLHILLIAIGVLILNSLQWYLAYRKVKEERIRLKVSWKEDIRPFFRFMGVGHLSNVINFFNYRLVLWIVAFYLDNYQLGLFALAAGLTQLLGFISTPLAQVLMPYLSAEKGEERNKLFVGFSRLHFSLMTVMSLFAALIAPLLIPLLYGAEFEASIPAFIILLIGAILSGQSRIFASLLIANDQLQYNLYATIIGFLLTFVSNFYLVQWYGIEGAAWAQSITYAGIFLAVYIAIIKFTEVKRYNLLLPTKEDISYARQKLRRKP